MALVDNNILSSLAKARNLSLLSEFFVEVKTTPEVIEEFRNEVMDGYKFVDRINEVKTFAETKEEGWLSVVSLTGGENRKKGKVLDSNESLGIADAKCLVVAEERNEILLTDDTYLGNKARSQGIKVYDLETFLEACVREEVIVDASHLRNILEEIEEKDYYSFSGGFKNRLFSIFEKS